jgi:CHASE1-domain containing sensor protein
MTFWLVLTLGAVLMFVISLAVFVHVKRHFPPRFVVNSAADQHGAALQRRINRVSTMTAAHRAALERDREYFDGLTAETRAMQAALDAEEEGNDDAASARHRR